MKLKSIIIIFLCAFILGLNTYSQNKKTDSLLSVIETSKEDTNKVNALIALGNQFITSDHTKSLSYAQQAMTLSEKIKWKKGTGKCEHFVGLYYLKQDDYQNAIAHWHNALKIKEELGDKNGIATSFGNLGIVYWRKGNYPLALDYYFKALKIAEDLGDKNGIARHLGNIGIIYLDETDYNKAQEYYFKALKINEELGDKNKIAVTLGNIGIVFKERHDYQKALNYYFQALKIDREQGNKSGIARHECNIGLAYSCLGDYPMALEYYSKALTLYEELGNKNGMATVLCNFGEMLVKKKNYKEANKYLNKALLLSSEIGYKDASKNILQQLSVVDSALGNYKDAFNHYRIYVSYRDSLANEENIRKQTRIEMQFNFDKKQAADSISVSEERKINAVRFERDKTQRYALYGGLSLVIIFAGLMFNRLKVTQNQKNIIEVKEQETQKQNIIILKQKHLIEEKHKEIKDSINYAERIQRSLLASKKLLDENLNEHFIFFQPKDIVSGDFYWAGKLSNNQFCLVTADSTGHGVPGAIMGILNISCLKETVKEGFVEPADILNHTRSKIIEILKKDGSDEGGKDGMDCSLISFDFINNKLTYAAANNPVWIVRGKEILEFAADKMPVGKHERDSVSFTQHTIPLNKGDLIYTLTDGIPDQFGGSKGKKFMYKNLKALLISIAMLPMQEQKNELAATFNKWKGDLEQVDDVTLIGVRV